MTSSKVPKARWYPRRAPVLDGETPGAYLARLTDPDKGPYNHRRSRQCAIASHDQCTDHFGGSCECPCQWDGIDDDTEESND